MIKIDKIVFSKHKASELYALVSDIANYKNYLPWCSRSTVLSHRENIIIGRVDLEYLKLKAHFTTKNTNYLNQKIDMDLVDGPFKHLKGYWKFFELETGSKIEFKLEYKFNNFIIEKILGSVFEFLIKNIVDSFIKKADEIYGKKT